MIVQSRPFFRAGHSLASVTAVAAIFLAVGTVVTVSACRSAPATAGNVQIDMRVVTAKTVGPASVEVTLRSPDGGPIDGAQVSLRGDMSHAGMQPVIVQMKPVAGGSYRADDFRFTMAGDWLLTVEAVLQGGQKVERTFDIEGVTPG